MEPITPNVSSHPAEQNPTHGGSFVRRADGSLVLRAQTKPSAEQPAVEPKTAGTTGNQEE